MVIVRGVNLHPSAVDDVVRRFEEVDEYQVLVQRAGAKAEVTIRIETASDDADVAARLESALRTAFSLRIPVAVAPRGSLPRFEMKARRWVEQS